jgi:regulator of protease activity HflC (stomatin/prohibitin superfamily)
MKRLHVILLAVAIFLVVVFVASLIRIGPDEVGVRINNFGFLGKGVVQEDFGPGWHVNLPLLHTFTVFPAKVRRIELTKDPRQRSSLGDEALLMQSSDGDRVMVDMHIFYRIEPGSAFKVLQDSGPGDGHAKVLKSLAKDRLRAVFGSLKTEEFYDPEARHKKLMDALEALRMVMKARSLDVVDVMIEDVEFEPKYEQKIKDKKLADQTGELNKAQARAGAEKAIVAGIQLETEKKSKLIQTEAEAEAAKVKAEGEKYAAKVRGDADLYANQLKAKGTLAIGVAEAKVKRLKTQALTGSGGSNLAALEAVSKLKIDSITFPASGSDWFDVKQMAARLGARP